MASVRRKGDTETRQVESFELELDEAGWEAMRADPEKYVRGVLASEIDHINRVSIDTRVLDALAGGGTMISPHVVHHTVSGQWQSWVEVTREY